LTVAQSAVTDLTTDLGNKAPAANPTFTGVASFPDGSASDPSITNTGDTNTGLAFPSDNTIIISTDGTERFRMGATGVAILGNGFSSATPALGDLRASSGSGTDVAGAALLLRGGYSTGSANGGPVSLWTSPSGSSGTSANTLTERFKVDTNGLITGTGTSLGAWTAYTPTIGGTGWALGSATVAAAYCQIGKVVHVRCRVVFAADSTFGASDLPTLSLPVTPNSAQNNGNFKLSGSAFDASLTAFYDISARFSSGVVAFRTNASPEASITATVPFTWTTSDQLAFSGTYEAA